VGVASLAALTMVGTADAASVLAFGLVPNGTKAATVSGSTTTIRTDSPAIPGSNLVTVSTLGNQQTLPGTQAKETFFAPGGVTPGIVSAGPATINNGVISQAFSGVISFLDPTLATNYLTISFTNAIFSGSQGGLTANLHGDNTLPGQTITFTSADTRVTGPPGPNFTLDPVKNFDISLTGLLSGLSTTGSGATLTVGPFTATNEGGAVSSFAVPEPSSVVMASTAVLAGLGCFGYRRTRSSSL